MPTRSSVIHHATGRSHTSPRTVHRHAVVLSARIEQRSADPAICRTGSSIGFLKISFNVCASSFFVMIARTCGTCMCLCVSVVALEKRLSNVANLDICEHYRIISSSVIGTQAACMIDHKSTNLGPRRHPSAEAYTSSAKRHQNFVLGV
jgi:hypothetical protein